MANILVVEDDREINALLCGILGQSGDSAESALSGAQGLRAFSFIAAVL